MTTPTPASWPLPVDVVADTLYIDRWGVSHCSILGHHEVTERRPLVGLGDFRSVIENRLGETLVLIDDNGSLAPFAVRYGCAECTSIATAARRRLDQKWQHDPTAALPTGRETLVEMSREFSTGVGSSPFTVDDLDRWSAAAAPVDAALWIADSIEAGEIPELWALAARLDPNDDLDDGELQHFADACRATIWRRLTAIHAAEQHGRQS